MGNSKKFYRKKQRNNKKALKSRKKRQRNEKNKAAAAASAFVYGENKNYDSHDLDTVAAFRVSIADTYTNPKCKGPHVLNSAGNLENLAALGIPTSHGVFIPKTETYTGTDDHQATVYAHDLESWNPNGDGVFIPKTEILTGFDDQTTPATIYVQKSWGLPIGDGVFIPKTETRTISTISDDQTPPATRSCDSVDLETMAALGVSVVHTHEFIKYEGPPVLNSAHDVKSWTLIGDGVYIPKTETHTRFDDQTTPFNISADNSVDLEAMAAMGISFVHSHMFPKYEGPPVLNSAHDVKSWTLIGDGVYIPKAETHTRFDYQTTPFNISADNSVDLEAMDAMGISFVHSHIFPKYEGPPVLNSAHDVKSWAALGNPYIY